MTRKGRGKEHDLSKKADRSVGSVRRRQFACNINGLLLIFDFIVPQSRVSEVCAIVVDLPSFFCERRVFFYQPNKQFRP